MPFDLPEELIALGPKFDSTLPSPASGMIDEVAWNPQAWSSAFITNGTLLAANLAKSVIPEIGWPESELPALENLAGVALALLDGQISLDEAVAIAIQTLNLLKDALPVLLQDVSLAIGEVVANVSSVIPVVGWLLSIAMFAWKAVKIIQASQFGLQGAENSAIQWDVIRDEGEANVVLDMLKARDWTPLWLPATGGWSAITVSYDPWGKASGWRFQPGGIYGDNRKGWIPGIAEGGMFYEGPAWGFDSKGPKLPSQDCLVHDKKCPQPKQTIQPLTTQASVFPSSAALVGLAWSFLQRPTGACCNVDLRKVEEAWNEWQIQGALFLDTPVGPQSSAPKGTKGGKGPRVKGLSYMMRAALGQHGDLYPHPGLVALQVRDSLRAMRVQIKKLLGTIAVAYVPGNAPALRDQELKARWVEMRKLLLKNPARYQVDLEMAAAADEIDGEEYAAALWHATRTADVGFAAPDVYKPEGGGKRRALDGGPPPDEPRLPRVPNRRGKSSGAGVGIAVAAAAAVGLGAFAFTRGGR